MKFKSYDIDSVNKNKIIFVLINIVFFVLLFFMNYYMKYVADDFSYMNIYSTNDRISSFMDVLISSKRHYLMWSGRILPHFLNYIYLMHNRLFFVFSNVIVYILFVYLIYAYCIQLDDCYTINNTYLLLSYSLLWLFLPDQYGIYLWHTASFNYFWSTFYLLLWFLPFFRYSILNISFTSSNNIFVLIIYFVLSVMFGFSHETQNGVILYALIFQVFSQKYIYNKKIEKWQIVGMVGILIGTLILVFSPGNFLRSQSLGRMSDIFIFELVLRLIRILFISTNTNPMYYIIAVVSYYIYYKLNDIHTILDKKNIVNLFFLTTFFVSIFCHIIVNGYIDRCLTISSVIVVIYLLYVIYNCLYNKNKFFFLILSIIISLTCMLDMAYMAFKLSGLKLFS